MRPEFCTHQGHRHRTAAPPSPSQCQCLVEVRFHQECQQFEEQLWYFVIWLCAGWKSSDYMKGSKTFYLLDSNSFPPLPTSSSLSSCISSHNLRFKAFSTAIYRSHCSKVINEQVPYCGRTDWRGLEQGKEGDWRLSFKKQQHLFIGYFYQGRKNAQRERGRRFPGWNNQRKNT